LTSNQQKGSRRYSCANAQLGAHFPRDVIAAAMLGLVWGILGALVAPYFSECCWLLFSAEW
jgi:membrane-associated phospholipid phosphatase